MSVEPVIIGRATLYLADARNVRPPAFDALITDLPFGVENVVVGVNSKKAKHAYAGAFSDTRENLVDLIAKVVAPALGVAKRAALTPGRLNQWLYPEPVDVGQFYQPAATSMSRWGRATWQPILFYGKDPTAGKRIYPLHYTLTEKPEEVGHPCPKPLGAWSWLVGRASGDGETVFDPFMGSGTTGVACARLGRPFVGVEIEPAYFEIACRRIEEAQRQGDFFVEAA